MDVGLARVPAPACLKLVTDCALLFFSPLISGRLTAVTAILISALSINTPDASRVCVQVRLVTLCSAARVARGMYRDRRIYIYYLYIPLPVRGGGAVRAVPRWLFVCLEVNFTTVGINK